MQDLKISIPSPKNLEFVAQMHQNSVFSRILELIIYNYDNKIN